MNQINQVALRFIGGVAGIITLCLFVTGCKTPEADNSMQMYESVLQQDLKGEKPAATKSLTLREGDVVKVTFSGAPHLNSTQPIRRDGKITVAPAGEIT